VPQNVGGFHFVWRVVQRSASNCSGEHAVLLQNSQVVAKDAESPKPLLTNLTSILTCKDSLSRVPRHWKILNWYCCCNWQI